jgi:hypothetical protein
MPWTASSSSMEKAQEATRRLLPSLAGFLQALTLLILSSLLLQKTSSFMPLIEKVYYLKFSYLFEQPPGSP